MKSPLNIGAVESDPVLNRVASTIAIAVIALSLAEFSQSASAKPLRSINSAIDISWIPDVELTGSKFRDSTGNEIDPIHLMKKSAIEYGRIRIFTSNELGHGTLERAIELTKRLKDENLKVILDFHLSDVWADPANQSIPADWSTTDADRLKSQMSDYLRRSLRKFLVNGITPDVVQIGNEIGNGFLWPLARIDSNDPNQWMQFVDIYNSGIETVRRVSPRSKILLHLQQPSSSWLSWWWNNAQTFGLKSVDFVGISYYSNWHGGLDELDSGIRFLGEAANQKVWIVETAYPWTNATFGNDLLNPNEMKLEGYGLTPAGQSRYVLRLQSLLRALPNRNGVGIGWWEGLSADSFGLGHQFRFGVQNSTLVDAKLKALPALRQLGKG